MTTIGKVFEVESAINQVAGLTAGKLGYALARNLNRAKDVTDAARKQLNTDIEELNKYLRDTVRKTKEEKEALKSELSDEHRAELDRLEKAQDDLLKEETEINWYKIKLTNIPGMGEDDAPEKGILPVAFFALFLGVGLIDDSEDKPQLKAVEANKE